MPWRSCRGRSWLASTATSSTNSSPSPSASLAPRGAPTRSADPGLTCSVKFYFDTTFFRERRAPSSPAQPRASSPDQPAEVLETERQSLSNTKAASNEKAAVFSGLDRTDGAVTAHGPASHHHDFATSPAGSTSSRSLAESSGKARAKLIEWLGQGKSWEGKTVADIGAASAISRAPGLAFRWVRAAGPSRSKSSPASLPPFTSWRAKRG